MGPRCYALLVRKDGNNSTDRHWAVFLCKRRVAPPKPR